jgi:hypothetical protein
VPPRFLELNEKAFEEGYRFGTELVGKEHVPAPAQRPVTREYRPSKVTRAKAGRRSTVLARAHRLTAKDLESDEAKRLWKESAKKGEALKAAERKALEEKMAAAGKRTAAKNAGPKKAAAKKPAAKKAGPKKAAPKKPAAKKAGPKKAAPKKPAAKKAAKKPTKKRSSRKK